MIVIEVPWWALAVLVLVVLAESAILVRWFLQALRERDEARAELARRYGKRAP